MQNAKASEAGNRHPVTPAQPVTNPLQESVQREGRLGPGQLRIRSDFADQIVFVHEAHPMPANNIKTGRPCQ